jgi:hypothetical protein
MSNKYIMIMIMCSSAKEANRIVESLLKKRL